MQNDFSWYNKINLYKGLPITTFYGEVLISGITLYTYPTVRWTLWPSPCFTGSHDDPKTSFTTHFVYTCWHVFSIYVFVGCSMSDIQTIPLVKSDTFITIDFVYVFVGCLMFDIQIIPLVKSDSCWCLNMLIRIYRHT